jgi:tryptophanyl-tRNA synthetase
MMKPRLLSGMQPSGSQHLGNWLGALQNWVALQDRYDCYYMVADLHSLTTGYDRTAALPERTHALVLDWLAAGLDPDRSVIFVQSAVPEHSQLALLLGMITPLGWVERVPTYKEKLRELAEREIQTYGFLGYPVLQAADILLYDAAGVPVGQDQVPHLEVTREIARRFNHLYGPVLVEPEALLTNAAVLPGTDGRKMSKSYGNVISLSDPPDVVTDTVRAMQTDPARVRRTDPGHPEVCPVFQLHRHFSGDAVARIDADCRAATLGCVDCKRELAAAVNRRLDPLRERRAAMVATPGTVEAVLDAGAGRARTAAASTLARVLHAMHFDYAGREGAIGGDEGAGLAAWHAADAVTPEVSGQSS